MKSNLLNMSMLALIIAGCSQNDITDVNIEGKKGEQISFEPTTAKSRATDATLATLQGSSEGFKVYATKGSSNEAFIGNMAYKYTSNKWTWDGTAPVWPDVFPVKFYAYFPSTEFAALSALTQDIAVKAPASQKDLLVAKAEAVAKPSTNMVALSFKHILSKINFQVSAASDITVYVQSIAIKNVHEKNTFDFSQALWTGTASQITSYSYLASPTSGVVTNSVSNAIQPITGTNGALMLLPQTLDAADWSATGGNDMVSILSGKAYVEVLYRLKQGNGNIIGYEKAENHPNYQGSGLAQNGYNDGLYIKVAYGLKDQEWNMGKAYIYTLTYPGTGGTLIDNKYYKEDGTDSGLIITSGVNPGEPPFNPGGEVTGDRIDFRVEVTPWDTPVNNPLN